MSFLENKVALGRNGIKVTELCFGTLTMSAIQADLSPESMEPVFRRALELGINFFDTAHRYTTYRHLRQGLGRDINDVVIASKTGAKTFEQGRDEIDGCFRDLGRDMIDIYLLHQVEDEADFELRRPIFDYLRKLQSQGRIRSLGVSAHRISGNEVAIRHADEMDILFPVINQQGLGIIDGTLEQAMESLKRARSAGLGIYAMKPLGGGHLRKNPIQAIEFLRKSPLIDAIAIGIKSVDEVEVNVAIFSDGKFPLDREKLESLGTKDRRTLINFLCKRCGKCVKYCDQGAISLGEKKAEVDSTKCILCGYCASHCPQFAIRVI
jgi:predicted aldo/keto reductase-like oxidoreductase